MSDDVAAERVHPDAGLLDARGIWDEDELIALTEPVDDARTLAEDSPVHGSLEARRIGEDGRHETPPGGSRSAPSHNSMERPVSSSGRCTRRSTAQEVP